MDCPILVVDDESSFLAVVSEFFGSRGFKVTTARELEEAEALVLKFPYALVIADLSLTKLNSDEGLRLMDLIRERSPRTRIILLSGRVSAEVREEALKRGAHAVLRKPQSLASIGEVAQQLLEVNDGQPA